MSLLKEIGVLLSERDNFGLPLLELELELILVLVGLTLVSVCKLLVEFLLNCFKFEFVMLESLH